MLRITKCPFRPMTVKFKDRTEIQFGDCYKEQCPYYGIFSMANEPDGEGMDFCHKADAETRGK